MVHFTHWHSLRLQESLPPRCPLKGTFNSKWVGNEPVVRLWLIGWRQPTSDWPLQCNNHLFATLIQIQIQIRLQIQVQIQLQIHMETTSIRLAFTMQQPPLCHSDTNTNTNTVTNTITIQLSSLFMWQCWEHRWCYSWWKGWICAKAAPTQVLRA